MTTTAQPSQAQATPAPSGTAPGDEAPRRARAARAAARQMARVTTDQKNDALHRIADALIAEQAEILQVNTQEVERARTGDINPAFLDRMTLTPERIAGIAADTRQIAALEDPVGQVESTTTRPNGLRISRVRVPLGVIGAIFESRPNVTVDIAALCLKSGNASVLRSGSDAHQTSWALARVVRRNVAAAGLPADSVQFIESTDRAEVGALLRQHESIDLMIPRGGAGLIRRVRDEATMPVVAGGVGVVHTYVDAGADLERAAAVVVNAKTRRVSICNALDTLLVHRDIAPDFLPLVARGMAEHQVVMHADERALPLLGEHGVPVEAADYDREWLAYECSVRVVDGIDEAIDHIDRHGSGHSEAILTESLGNATRFQREVDAAAVFVNASTQFTDGAQFGLGAEIGISTQKMHARGPMALRELTSYKWLVNGDGQTRTD